MDPLIITASCGRVRPGSPSQSPASLDEVAQSVFEAWQAGASIAQIRAPMRVDDLGRPATRLEDWTELVSRIRNRCDIVVHFGVAAMRIEQRVELMSLRPEMASFLLGHHDLMFPDGQNLYALRTREESLQLAQACLEYGVKPEFEIFHSGALWNLQFILERVAVPQPLWLTLFFGWSGGEWSPATPQELLHRASLIPSGSRYTVSMAADGYAGLAALAMTMGGNVRVGLGDYAFFQAGVPAESNAQFVARIVRIAAELDRPVASPSQARALLGLS